MSYAFDFIAEDKYDAVCRAFKEFEQIVANQPSHVQDSRDACDALQVFLEKLRPQRDHEAIRVSMHGSLSWDCPSENPATVPIMGVGLSINAWYTNRE